MSPKYANRRDDNEPELLGHMRSLGGHWYTAPPLDGWVWIPRQVRWVPVEIKMPEREGLKYEHTPAQKRFITWAKQNNALYFVWRTPDDVIRDLGARRSA